MVYTEKIRDIYLCPGLNCHIGNKWLRWA